MSRHAFFAGGGFDESLPPYGVHDVEFSLRIRKAGCTIGPAPDMVVHFRRTTDLHALVRKIYRSGKTETLVWDRHPDLFPSQAGFGRAIQELLRLPYDVTHAAISGDSLPSARSLAREAIVRAAYVAAQRPGGLRSHDGNPRLLCLSDDPVSANSDGVGGRKITA